jgi:hypothetical protein
LALIRYLIIALYSCVDANIVLLHKAKLIYFDINLVFLSKLKGINLRLLGKKLSSYVLLIVHRILDKWYLQLIGHGLKANYYSITLIGDIAFE